ncbi:MAG: alanine--tRNA ligase [Firmicutes bacterium]|nr:alanine--tRNA ligase [Bacillota bacterium]
MDKNITSEELRKKWLDFFASRGHAVIPSASLIPENDPTVLFTTAGMHPLVPYLLGQKHPSGTRLTNVQKCVRTGDIDEVGDDSHCTFFEMMGNWSLGDYFKKEMIEWSYEFLTKELSLDPKKLAVSVFLGDKDAPKDNESAEIWKKCGIKKDRIYFLPKANNWWGPAGVTGPCGPDTEMFIDKGNPCGKKCSPACDCGNYLEIWNDVFMQYCKDAEGKFSVLKQQNVDTGMGLERTLCTLLGKKSVYDTDLFCDAIAKLEQLSGQKYGQDNEVTKNMRVILDHIRTSVFMIGDTSGIVPSNTDQGYILRRLLRRAIRFSQKLGVQAGGLSQIAKVFVQKYQAVYEELKKNQDKICTEIDNEETKFEHTLSTGQKEFDKLCGYLVGDTISGKAAFKLYDTYGYPIELTVEMAREKGLQVNLEDYHKCYAEHQQKSAAGAEAKFKGGLADNTEATTHLHTATHLMHKALKTVLKDDTVGQKGSNITAERLRFDFNFSRPLTEQEISQVETMVNQAIAAKADIECKEMTVEQAKSSGAIGLFDQKYGEKVKVYTMGAFSKEICGGPHASNTGDLGVFKITKEQSSSAGVRRIKATLTK